jgi:hypothetical protein
MQSKSTMYESRHELLPASSRPAWPAGETLRFDWKRRSARRIQSDLKIKTREDELRRSILPGHDIKSKSDLTRHSFVPDCAANRRGAP